MKNTLYIIGIVAAFALLILAQYKSSEVPDRSKTEVVGNVQVPEAGAEAQPDQANEANGSVQFVQRVFESGDLVTGVIGLLNGSIVDDPKDNTFHIEITENIEPGVGAYLVYELYGVEDYTSISRSINDHLSLGGAYVSLNNEWSEQRERISIQALRQGDNIIRFSVPGQSAFGYMVKNVRIEFGERESPGRAIVINQPKTRQYYHRYGYVSGYIQGLGSERVKVYADGMLMRSYESDFEGIAECETGIGRPWKSVITAVFEDGEILTDTVEFEHEAEFAYNNACYAMVPFAETRVSKGNVVNLSIEGFSLQGDPGSVADGKQLTVTGLRTEDMALLGTSMINVTGENDGYRCLPHGSQFEQAVELRIKYDVKKIPEGYGPNDIRTYYYDEEQEEWIMMAVDSIDIANGEIVTRTSHFTDFINAIMKTPESPTTQAYTPTSLKDMAYGDPVAGINMMSPPSANNNGTANMSYPIVIPAGRQGMQPQLAITYSSGGGNGWLGLGWNLNTPSISVDTRWGVPHFYTDKESESYIVNGEQLLPMVQRDSYQPRSANAVEVFTPRIEGSFEKIERHGTSTSTYWWEVTDKQGIRYLYGKYESDAGVNNDCVLRDDNGNIAQWALAEVRDLNDNYIKYTYTEITHSAAPGAGGRDLYLSSIAYTGSGTTDGAYKVEFVTDDPNVYTREDYIISGRYGFMQVTDRLLRLIKVSYDDQFVRAYAITYKEGAYNKKLICAITEISDSSLIAPGDNIISYDCDDIEQITVNRAKVHQFDYYEETNQTFGTSYTITEANDAGEINLMDQLFSLPEELALGMNISNGKSIGGSLNIGFGPKFWEKSNSVGGSYTYSASTAKDYLMLMDIDGDGLPDKVMKTPTGIYYRKMLLNGEQLQYASDSVLISGLPAIGRTVSSSDTWGIEAQILIVGASASTTRTNSITPEYFADVNADGLPDYISEGKVYYNILNSNGIPEFVLESNDEIQYIGGDSCNYILRTGSVIDSVYTPSEEIKGEEAYEYHRDGVRIWIAPYTGTITLDNEIQLIEDTSYSRSQSMKANGVRYVVQRNGLICRNERIYESDYAVHQWDSTFSVTKGDRFYFRLQSMNDRSYDDVIWNPIITYSGIDTASVDADHKKIGVFEPAEDLLVNDKQIFRAPYTGKIMLRGSMTSGALSDTLIFRIKNGTSIFSTNTFVDNSAINYTLNDSMEVDEGDSIIFEAYTSTNVGWNGIDMDFRIFYSYADSVSIDTNSVNSNIEVRPMVQLNLYQNTIYKTEPISMNSGTYTVNPLITASASANGVLTLAVKKEHDILCKKTVTIVNGQVSGVPMLTFTTTGGNVYFEYYTTNTTLASLISSARVQRYGGKLNHSAGLHTIVPDSMWKFGNLYRGWGQFSYYDGYDTTTVIQPIDEDSLYVNELYRDTTLITLDTTSITDFQSAVGEMSISGLNKPNLVTFNMMFANLDSMEWRDYAQSSSVGYDKMSNACHLINTTTDTVYDGPIIIGTSPNEPIRVIRKAREEGNIAWSITANIGSLSGGMAWNDATSLGLLDYIDMNGDRYPDIVGTEYVQFTTPQGGLSESLTSMLSGKLDRTYSSGSGVSAGVNLPVSSSSKSSMKNIPRSSCNMSIITRYTKKKNFLSGGVSTYNTESEADFVLMDMNGDGLPDKFNKTTGNISLSLGYGYGNAESWDLVQSNKDTSTSYEFSVGGGQTIETALQNILTLGIFNKSEFSWSGGVSLSFSSSERQYGMIDMNNDGLLDIAYYDNGTLYIITNNGNGENNNTSGWSGATGINNGKTTSASANLAGSIGFPVFFVKVVLNLQVGTSGSVTMEKLQLTDMNNDGYPDIVYIDGLSTKVMTNNLGKINLLKQVTTPLTSQYIIDYSLNNCDQDMPMREWNMSSLKVFDGFTGDGQDTSYQKFEYAGGFYDRFERTFYGYDTVKTEQYNTFYGSTSNCYRSVTARYHNDDYMFKGLKFYEVSKDSSNNKYIETYYSWSRLEIATGVIVPDSDAVCYGPYYPGVTQENRFFYEGNANYAIHTRKAYAYGAYGNVEVYTNFADVSDTSDNIVAEIEYANDLNLNLLSMVDTLRVYDYENNLLQRRVADYDGIGQMVQIGAFDGTTYAYTDLDYDSYGNISHIEYPLNENSERMEYDYTYDPDVHTYPYEITDYWSNTSTTWYDLRFGVPTKTLDVCGNYMEFYYYDDGKIESVLGPKEMAANIPYTIKFEYWDEQIVMDTCRNKWAKTLHYDTLNTGNEFVTINFADGLGRTVQTKQNATIGGVDSMMVSGRVYYDAYGRATTVSLPTAEALGTELVFNNYTPVNFATSILDELDRPLVQIAPDTTQVSMEYDFGTDAFGKTCFESTITDPNGKVITRYTDARGLNTSVTAPLNTITKFEYSPLGELLESTDPEANTTSYAYDMLGRLISRDHPDAGLTSYTYDLAGNVLTTQTEVLNGLSSDIEYNYSDNRLSSITYPINPEMNVYYEYGLPNTGNQSGRLVKMQDASGVQTFEYGDMGELIKNIHTFVVPNGVAYTFETQWEYDSWNRMKTIVYPDSEVVSYHYNNGGQLIGMDGVKGSRTYAYIDDILYNRYGSRERIEYGNGTYAEYTYNPLNQRLTNLSSYELLGGVMQDIDYTYDDAGNILTINGSGQYVGTNNDMGGAYTYEYTYDDLYRLTEGNGIFVSYNNGILGVTEELTYSASGNIMSKSVDVDKEIGGGVINVTYNNAYTYGNQPHAVSSAGNTTYQWDANGNMTQRDNGSQVRQMCWDEENRLTTVHDINEDGMLSSYIYNAGGERVWKMSGASMMMMISGQMVYSTVDYMKTLYASPLMVLTEEEYTKHYYIEGERVCSKIGGGFALAKYDPESTPIGFVHLNDEEVADDLWSMVLRGVYCSGYDSLHMNIKGTMSSAENDNDDVETNQYFYHSDHLGSASFISDATGYATQHLQYLPYGETFVDQHGAFDSRYTFSAKEKDDETQYSYFGARYYDSDLSVWLSVDNYADLAPNCSPYSYVFGNPVNLTDPDGNFPGDGGGDKVHIKHSRKVKNQNSTPNNRNRAGQKYGSGIGYRATDIYNTITGDNAAHKVRAGQYVTSPWTQLPQTGQNGNWTSHRFSGRQYNPNDYRLRNTRMNITSNNPINVFALLSGDGVPINFGCGLIPYNILTGNYNYSQSGALIPFVNQLIWTDLNNFFMPSMIMLGKGWGVATPILLAFINSAGVNPLFANTNSFHAYSDNAGSGTSHTLWIKYRMWQAGGPYNIIMQAFRRILYGFNGNR